MNNCRNLRCCYRFDLYANGFISDFCNIINIPGMI